MSFLKGVLATLTGLFLFCMLLFFILIGMAASGSESPEPYVRANSVLKITLAGGIPERGSDDPFAVLLDPAAKDQVNLSDLRVALRRAATDSRISGVWLELTSVSASYATLEELHAALLHFKESGKFLYASTTDLGMTEAGVYLATAADSLFAPEQSYVEFNGLFLQGEFYKRAMDRWGVAVDVVNTGDFKTAAEPYTAERFSAANRVQLGAILNQAADRYLGHVAAKTGHDRARLDAILNGTPVFTATDAHRIGLVDSLLYPDQLEDLIAARAGASTLQTVSFARYRHTTDAKAGQPDADSGTTIAVLHAQGMIMPIDGGGLMGGGVLTAQAIRKQVEAILADPSIKAVVVRIDSPGGAATTSELIWKDLRELADSIPMVASMGPVAASGGYYIAMAADTVVANPTTITGSIGVIAQKISAGRLLEQEIGITYDEIMTHPHAGLFDLTSRLTEGQRASLARSGDETYTLFRTRVAENRGMTLEEVHRLGQGRVWTGADAHANGLVDVLGGLDDALAIAAEMAGVDSYTVRHFPAPQTFVEKLLENAQPGVLLRTLLPAGTRIPEIPPMLQGPHIALYMPYVFTIR